MNSMTPESYFSSFLFSFFPPCFFNGFDLAEMVKLVSCFTWSCVLGFLQRFAAVIMRIREPKTTAFIFASGKMVSFDQTFGTF